MVKTIVCYKWVRVEDDIRISQPDLNVDLSKAKGKISDYDRNAIETARQFSTIAGSEPVGLTFGSGDIKSSLKDALSRGLAQAYWVNDAAAGQADGMVTANVLAAAISKLGDYNLVICADGAADTYAHQVGPRLGALLGLPVISSVRELTVEGERLIAVRKLDNCTEKVAVSLPAVVTVLPEINPAPIPGLKAVLDAGKKPNTELKLSELELSAAQVTRPGNIKSFKGYVMARKNIIFSEGDLRAQVETLVSALKKEGVI